MAKSDLVSGMGLITDLVHEVRRQGGADDDVHRLSRPEGKDTLRKMAALAVADGAGETITADEAYWRDAGVR